MTWPTDDLTNTQLDGGTDDPSLARTQLNALLLKVQAILAEVTAGAKVWHSANDGTGSGLDADTLDGKHLSEIKHQFLIAGNTRSTDSFFPGGSASYWASADGAIYEQAISTTSRSLVPKSGTLKKLIFQTLSNTTDIDVLVRVWLNGITPTSLSLTIPAGTGGVFSISSDVVVYATTEISLVVRSASGAAATGSISYARWQLIMED